MKKLGLIGLAISLVTAAQLIPGAGEASQAAQALQLGTTLSARASDSTPAVFEFVAETAGFLSVAVRGTAGTDLILLIADDLGQPLPDARSDQDLLGETSAEQLMATITRPGTYHVRVETWSGSSEFDLAASWIAFPSIATQPDPDGRPTEAARLVPGTPISDSLEPAAGDAWDWFSFTSDSGGVLTVVTEAAEGDLALEVFAEGEFSEALQRSDQDSGGVAGNESISMRIEAGQTLYFRVSPVFVVGDPIMYTIRAGIM